MTSRRSHTYADNTIFGLREDQARLEQELHRARSRRLWIQGHGYGYQEPKRQFIELDMPRLGVSPARPFAGGSMVFAEGCGARAGYTPYRASPLVLQSRGRSNFIWSWPKGVTSTLITCVNAGVPMDPGLIRMRGGVGLSRHHVA